MAGRNVTKTEWLLLGLTGIFLCGLLTVFFRDRQNAADGVEPAVSVPQEEMRMERLDLNRAGAAELCGLPGIGEELAGRILAYRETHGAFSSVEELMEVPGIGEAKLEAIRDRVCVDGEAVK